MQLNSNAHFLFSDDKFPRKSSNGYRSQPTCLINFVLSRRNSDVGVPDFLKSLVLKNGIRNFFQKNVTVYLYYFGTRKKAELPI